MRISFSSTGARKMVRFCLRHTPPPPPLQELLSGNTRFLFSPLLEKSHKNIAVVNRAEELKRTNGIAWTPR